MSQKPKDTQRKLLIALGLAAAVVAGGVFLYIQSQSEKEEEEEKEYNIRVDEVTATEDDTRGEEQTERQEPEPEPDTIQNEIQEISDMTQDTQPPNIHETQAEAGAQVEVSPEAEQAAPEPEIPDESEPRVPAEAQVKTDVKTEVETQVEPTTQAQAAEAEPKPKPEPPKAEEAEIDPLELKAQEEYEARMAHYSKFSENLKKRKKYRYKDGNLVVKCVRGINIDKMDRNSESDPYVKVIVGKQKKQTKAIKDNANPVWGETLAFTVADAVRTHIEIRVYDEDKLARDSLIGSFVIKVTDICARDGTFKSAFLIPQSKQNAQVVLELHYYEHKA